MSATVHELIGRIIDPGPARLALTPPRPRRVHPWTVSDLIGMVVGPPGLTSSAPRMEARAAVVLETVVR